ncbi:MAG: hypothetical protein KIT16_10655, partial [Rhodospirillaceae bacterium]|nr:hypothetical protein [Rhodospirillaceae bacterium]
MAVLAALSVAAPARAQTGERLVYEIVLTLAGSRSQGWYGTLYDGVGRPQEVVPGRRIATDIGELVGVAPRPGMMWRPHGWVPATPGMRNDTAKAMWTYRLFVTGEGTACPSWRGVLLRDGAAMKPLPDAASAATPWGPFLWIGPRHG